MEEIIIVDKNNKVIGYKRRDLVSYDDIYRVSGLIVRNKEDILLAQRSLEKTHYPGRWAISCAGTVAKGESYEDNIYKEANEELGISGLKFEHLNTQFWDDGKYKFFASLFTIELDWSLNRFKLQKEEVNAIKWINYKTLAENLKNHPSNFTPNTDKLITMFIDYIYV